MEAQPLLQVADMDSGSDSEDSSPSKSGVYSSKKDV